MGSFRGLKEEMDGVNLSMGEHCMGLVVYKAWMNDQMQVARTMNMALLNVKRPFFGLKSFLLAWVIYGTM